MKLILKHHHENFRLYYNEGAMLERLSIFVSQAMLGNNGNLLVIMNSVPHANYNQQLWDFSVNPGTLTEQELNEICHIAKMFPGSRAKKNLGNALKDFLIDNGFRYNCMEDTVLWMLEDQVQRYFHEVWKKKKNQNDKKNDGEDESEESDDSNVLPHGIVQVVYQTQE